MDSKSKNITRFLLVTQGAGAVFTAFFLAAYLLGLPSTRVLHSEPAFNIPLMIFGSILLALTLAGLVLASLVKND
jgi:hypothetical protein